MNALADVLPFALVLARVLPLGVALAFWTGELAPRVVCLALCLPVAAALWPLAGPVEPSGNLAGLVVQAARELCIGATFALALAMALVAVGWAVRFAQPRASNPAVEPFAQSYVLCAAFLVLSLGGLRAVVIGLAESFGDAAIGGTQLRLRELAFGALQIAADAFATALGFALPLLFAVWLLELSGSLLQRVLAPSTQGQSSLVRPLSFFGVAALLLVPVASRAPELVRAAILTARTLTRALAR